MRLFLIIIFLISRIYLCAQEPKIIFANENDAVALFFPNTINQALTGSENFTFSYNRDSPQHIGVVQGVRGLKSNLLVMVENGDVYSYRLVYRKALDTLNYFIKAKERIGNEAPLRQLSQMKAPPKIMSDVNYNIGKIDSMQNRREYFKKLSVFHLSHNDNLLKKRRKQGLVIVLKDLIYNRTEVYALFEIRNRSGIDFGVDYLKIFKINGNVQRKSSYQKLPLYQLYEENFPKMVRDGKCASFAVVLPKFTLGDSEKLMIELKELRGSRNVLLYY